MSMLVRISAELAVAALGDEVVVVADAVSPLGYQFRTVEYLIGARSSATGSPRRLQRPLFARWLDRLCVAARGAQSQG
jgi:hypothetical protein